MELFKADALGNDLDLIEGIKSVLEEEASCAACTFFLCYCK